MESNNSEKELMKVPTPNEDNCKLFGGVVKIPREVMVRIWSESQTLEEVHRRLRLESSERGINYDKDLGIFTWWDKKFFYQQQYERESLKPHRGKEDPDPDGEVIVKRKNRKNRDGLPEYKRSRNSKYTN